MFLQEVHSPNLTPPIEPSTAAQEEVSVAQQWSLCWQPCQPDNQLCVASQGQQVQQVSQDADGDRDNVSVLQPQ